MSWAFEALFNSPAFVLIFLPLFLAVFWATPWRRGKQVVLIAAGLTFYSFWDFRFAGLLLAAAIVDYFVALRMHASRHKREWLALSIAFNLGILVYFKYAIFAADAANSLLRVLGSTAELPGFSIVLPLGISFFTFKTMSYTIDVYRGEIPPTRNLVQYVAFVTLLPDIVAGPIVRYRDLSRQLDELPRSPRREQFSHGVTLFAIGLFKKVVIADSIASAVGFSWSHPGVLSSPEAILAIVGYALQLYFDFSGYSDMAMGIAAMLGIEFPVNFVAPYQARNPSDFWRRWHVSLSSWLRDYVYIPLGGNRGSKARVYLNLILVMLIGGLWHGAAWTFVVWGCYHGLALAYYKAAGPVWDAAPVVVQRVATLVIVFVGWIVFRAESLGDAGLMMAATLRPADAGEWAFFAPTLAVLAALLAFVWFVPPSSQLRASSSARRAAFAATLLSASLLVLLSQAASPFLYYQF